MPKARQAAQRGIIFLHAESTCLTLPGRLPVVTPTWVGPIVAIALVLIAVAFLLIAGILIRLAFDLKAQGDRMASHLDRLSADFGPILTALASLVREADSLKHSVRHEAEAILLTSRRLRRRVTRGADRVQERFEELDALYEVLREEVEDTSLGVAAAVRTVRTSVGLGGKFARIGGQVSRFLTRRARKRRRR